MRAPGNAHVPFLKPIIQGTNVQVRAAFVAEICTRHESQREKTTLILAVSKADSMDQEVSN